MINNPAVGSVLCVLQERPAVRSSYEQSVPPLAESLHWHSQTQEQASFKEEHLKKSHSKPFYKKRMTDLFYNYFK